MVEESLISGLTATLISTQEGSIHKHQIETAKKEGMWLYFPDGFMHVEHPKGALPKDLKKLQEILLDVNLFNGNMGYLLMHKDQLNARYKDKKELLLRFLALHAEKSPEKKAVFQELKRALK